MLAEKSINAFTKPDRLLAIEAISLHKKYEKNLNSLKTSFGNKKDIPIDFLDLLYMFDKIAQSWADVVDLVKPIYNE
jgi:histone deacetylase complex regulatory component SIN3